MQIEHLKSRLTWRRILLTALLIALNSTPLWAKDGYLSPGKVDAVQLLSPPPADGSVEQQADLATVEAAFKNRTKADEELGNARKGHHFLFVRTGRWKSSRS